VSVFSSCFMTSWLLCWVTASFFRSLPSPALPTSFCQHHTQSECFPSTFIICHAAAMLTHPDRKRFEQIRARWEAGQQGEEESADMVGRRLSQQPASGDAPSNGTSKFRRTLSHGLAFISNPLSQRKTTPSRQAAPQSILVVTAPVTNASPHRCDAPLSPTRDLEPSERRFAPAREIDTPIHRDNLTVGQDIKAFPTALPRSRTTSLLPLPVRSGSDGSAHSPGTTIKPKAIVGVTEPKLRAMQSKIPTPSPPPSERRVSSPRLYRSRHTTRQENHIDKVDVAVGNNGGSPSKVVVRSRTTSNLVEVLHSSQPAAQRALAKESGYKKLGATHTTQKPILQENLPANKRVSQRHSQPQDKALRRESLAVHATLANRRSFGQNTPIAHSKQSNQATPLTAEKRLSSSTTHQTPATVKRVQPKEQELSTRNSSSITQSRLMGPRNPSTPTPRPTKAAGLAPPRLTAERDMQRKTLGTPNGLAGIWRSSRALAATNHEVRRLPRSSTFHNFGTGLDSLPPVPQIPDQYRIPSLSSFFQPRSTYNHRSKMASAATSCESILEEDVKDVEAVEPTTSGYPRPIPAAVPSSAHGLITHPTKWSKTSSSSSIQSALSMTDVPYKKNERPWSISDPESEDSADIEFYYQARDCMPPLYWAGRFQSRYDHWRTEAMMVELDPRYIPEDQLGECRLSQDKLAACYIFAQLRELCLTEQAADSLWVRDIAYLSSSSTVLIWRTGL
jgi:hypothetical protein